MSSTTTTRATGCIIPISTKTSRPLALTEKDIDDLGAFLASLTSADYTDQGTKELARQREISLTKRPQRDTARAFGPKPPRPEPPGP
jgi:cytochrome c peroxidase